MLSFVVGTLFGILRSDDEAVLFIFRVDEDEGTGSARALLRLWLFLDFGVEEDMLARMFFERNLVNL